MAWRVQAATDGGGGGGGGRRWRPAAARVTMGRLAGSSPSARPATPCCTLLASSFLCSSPFRFALTVPGNPLRPPNRLQVIGRGRGIVRGGSQDEAGRQPRSSHLLKPGRASEPDIAGWRCWMEMIKRAAAPPCGGPGASASPPARRRHGGLRQANGPPAQHSLALIHTPATCPVKPLPARSLPQRRREPHRPHAGEPGASASPPARRRHGGLRQANGPPAQHSPALIHTPATCPVKPLPARSLPQPRQTTACRASVGPYQAGRSRACRAHARVLQPSCSCRAMP